MRGMSGTPPPQAARARQARRSRLMRVVIGGVRCLERQMQVYHLAMAQR
jgi:hypothetical protein